MALGEASKDFAPLAIALLTVSDSREAETDKSGDLLAQRIAAAGHRLAARAIVADEKEAIARQVSSWIADQEIQIVITTGGTGLTARDVTPDALKPLFEKEMEGFAFLFHRASFETIGVSTLLSRACAGVSGSTCIFALPGSPGACQDGWDRILRDILDSRHAPCNLAALFHRL